jgi:hypothetical protein
MNGTDAEYSGVLLWPLTVQAPSAMILSEGAVPIGQIIPPPP